MKLDNHLISRHWTLIRGALITLIVLALIGSCKKIGFKGESDGNAVDNSLKSNTIVPCGTPTTVNLMAGQNIDIGSVQIANTLDSLYITITSEGAWWLKAANIYVGTLSGMPQTPNGNPKIGHFPYKKTFNPMKQTVRFAIPLTGLPACYIAAVHVEVCRLNNGIVVQNETAWGQGSPMPGANWAMFINYCTQVCNPCVYDIISTPLYAGQTIPAGTVLITNDADSIYVTINLASSWYLRQLHVYVGSYQNMPMNSQNVPIPGQFPINLAFSGNAQSATVSYSLNGLQQCYIVAVHAEVSQIINGVTVQTETAWSFGDPFINTNRWGWTTPYCTQICNE
jgi:hypothetical protein